eukprot:TRINITY_DN2118_c0_g3_i1.p1 TRINITY_DN2118_c0_g3~~TRINITY_DN2118_c0_g3_i1.p1  ORF type:complete len:512 (-),score=120.16 TRINITY_DN2118_c0_g3_i1:311-1846(-)
MSLGASQKSLGKCSKSLSGKESNFATGNRIQQQGAINSTVKKLNRVTNKKVMSSLGLVTEPLMLKEEAPMARAKSSSIISIILGGGAGTRLYPLTAKRAKPAVPIGGAYRLIDVPMSNCINSGINKIYILTQFNSTSLNRHLSRTYNVGTGVRFGGDAFVEVLAATQTPKRGDWFQGTADAVRQYSWLLADIKNRVVEDIVILSGDHLYRMDYMAFVDYHREKGADITIGVVPCDEERATGFGLMKIDDDANVIDFAEKPKGDALQAMQVDTTILGLDAEEAKQSPYIASMGIYVFKRDALLNLLNDQYPTANDFGGEIIPQAAKDGKKVVAYLFDDYWEDIGTIKSFFEANLALTKQPPVFEFYDPFSPIYTSSRFLPPAKVVDCKVADAIIGHGTYLRECHVENAIIGLRARVDRGVIIKDAMLMGADEYEGDEQRKQLESEGKVPLGVGANSVIMNSIVDKNARIGKNVTLVNQAGVEEANREDEGIYIKSGIVVVVAGSTIPDNMVV